MARPLDTFQLLEPVGPYAGDDQSILEREIVAIQELLDEQPDSKCEENLSLVYEATDGMASGCMESLVFYKRLLLRRHKTSMNSNQRESTINDCADLLARLQEVDPDRRQRYADLCKWLLSL